MTLLNNIHRNDKPYEKQDTLIHESYVWVKKGDPGDQGRAYCSLSRHSMLKDDDNSAIITL